MAKDALGHGSDGKGEHSAGIQALPVKQTPKAADLKLFADNDGQLYRSSQKPIEDNLDKKVVKGTYDHEKSKVLWGYHADRAAQSYNKQMPDFPGQKWHEQFSPSDRRAAAQMFASSYKSEHINGGSAAYAKGTKRVSPIRVNGWEK